MDKEGSVLGIDVGWSRKRNSSAVCRLSWSDHEIEWKIGRFIATDYDRERTISRVAKDNSLLAVAIDGPLRPSFDEIGHYRSAERILSRGDLRKLIGKPGQSSSVNGKKLNAQANKSAEVVKQRCHICEACHQIKIDEYLFNLILISCRVKINRVAAIDGPVSSATGCGRCRVVFE